MTKARELINLCEDNLFAQSLLEFSLIVDANEALLETDEGISDLLEGGKKKLKEILDKLGLDIQHSKGLIHILISAGATMTKFIFHALKAFVFKDDKSKKIVKELANKEITQDQLYDFLLKLDTASFKLLTGPINMINAITGWRIVPRKILSDKMKQLRGTEIIAKAISEIKDALHIVPDVLKKKLLGHVKRVEKELKPHIEMI